MNTDFLKNYEPVHSDEFHRLTIEVGHDEPLSSHYICITWTTLKDGRKIYTSVTENKQSVIDLKEEYDYVPQEEFDRLIEDPQSTVNLYTGIDKSGSKYKWGILKNGKKVYTEVNL